MSVTTTVIPAQDHPTRPRRVEARSARRVDPAVGHRPVPSRVMTAARRIPATLSLVALLIGAGIVTGTLWAPIDPAAEPLRSLSFGVPSVQAGHWWTFLTGAVVLPRPEYYLVVAALLLAGLGAYEHRVGSLRAAAALLGTQLIGTVGAALVLWPFDDRSWPWAAELANRLDLGLTAGMFGLAGAATAVMSETARRRVRAVGLTYLAMLAVKSGLLWDLEHLVAFGAGLAAGPRLAGRRPLPFHRPRIDSLRVRICIALVIATVAVANVVESILPGIGGIFGSGLPTHAPLHGLVLMAGELMVVLLVADGLRRGRAAAWWLASVGTAGVLVNSLVNSRGAMRISDALAAASILGLLLAYRNAWRWRTPDGFAITSLRRVSIAVVAFGGGLMVLLFLVRHHLDPAPGLLDLVRETMSRLTFNQGPLRATAGVAKLVLAVGTITWAAALIGLLVPWIYADRGPESSPREVVGSLLRTHGGGSLGWMRTWPAFTTWTTRDGRSAISYCVVGTVAIAIGDPVGPESGVADAVRGFRQFCQYAGWTPCWFAATPALVQAAPGWRATQIGEDTVMDLRGMEFVGKSWQDVRTARNRATREGITMLTGQLADFPAELRGRIEAISREWVSQKSLPEMGFTLGTVGHALDPEMRTHVAVGRDGEVQGVTTWLPVHRDGAVVGWTLDLMRRRPDGFRPVIEFLIAESALQFQAEGYESVSLSVAPLARRTPPTGRRTMLDRTLDLMSGLLEPAYGFRSLLAFKAKFHPEFRPVYLVYSGPAELLAISLAIGRAYLPNLDTRQTAQLLRGLRHPAHSPSGA